MEQKLYVSSSPHMRHGGSTSHIMRDVIIALLPAVIASVVLFGPRSLLVIGVCILSAVFLNLSAEKL